MSVSTDCQGLYNAPTFPGAIQWSEDNLLAVGSGASVIILDPSDLSGPRMFTHNEGLSAGSCYVGEGPRDSLHCSMAELRDPRQLPKERSLFKDVPRIRSLAWSPAAASSVNSCLLATVDTGAQVHIFEPSSCLQSKWVKSADLTAKLLAYLTSTSWREAVREKPLAVASLECDSMLRLRGGGRRKRQRTADAFRRASNAQASSSAAAVQPPAVFQPGDSVEVHIDESGLRDCWFMGVVQQTAETHALVTYNELEDEDGRPLQEWFPLPGSQPEQHGIASPFTVHTLPTFMMRPLPTAHVAGAGQPRQPGEAVDVLLDGGWWLATVVKDLGNGTLKAKVGRKTLDMPYKDVRARLKWHPNKGATNEAWETLNAQGQRLSRRVPQQATSKDLQESAGPNNEPTSGIEEPAAHAMPNELSAADMPAVEDSSAAASAGAATVLGVRGKKAQDASAAAAYVVPEDFDAGELLPIETGSKKEARVTAVAAFAQRYFQLREQVPMESRPEYTKANEHLKGIDIEIIERVTAEILKVHGQQLAAQRIDIKTLTTEGRRAIRLQWDRTTGEAKTSKPKVPKPVQPAKPTATPTYQVPDDFDAESALAGADASSKRSIQASFPLGFLLRWLTLRSEISDEHQVTYDKGQHLRGRDAELADQVCAEMVHAFKQELEEVGLTDKWLTKEGRVQIRNQAIRTRSNPAACAYSRAKYSDLLLGPLQRKIDALLRVQFPSEEVSEELSDSPAPSPVAQHKRGRDRDMEPSNKRRKASEVADARGGPLELLTAPEYEARLFAVSALQVAWSPVFQAAGCSQVYAMLAVGTKSGRVWLWRYQMPSSFAPSGRAQQCTVVSSFALVGSFVGHAAWIKCLKWVAVGDSLVLATGCSEGGVRLYSALQSSLAALPELLPAAQAEQPPAASATHATHSEQRPSEGVHSRGGQEGRSAPPADSLHAENLPGRAASSVPLMRLLHVVAHADLRTVTAIDVRTGSGASAGETVVSVAAGKSSGRLLVWRGTLLKTGPGRHLAMGASTSACRDGVHACLDISGVSWSQSPPAAAAPDTAPHPAALLCTSGVDGSVRSWMEDGSQLREVDAAGAAFDDSLAATEQCNSHRRCRALGVATSGNGLFAAVARESLYARALDSTLGVAGSQFQKVFRGTVQLLRLHGPGAPLGPNPAVALSALPDLAEHAPPYPANRLWDAAAAVNCSASSSGDADAGPAACDAARSAALQAVQGLLSKLEEPYLLHATGTADILQFPETTWRGLQLSNALRRLLQDAGGQDRGEDSRLCRPLMDSQDPDWAAALQRNELALLQRHICATLSAAQHADAADCDTLSRAVMLAWTCKHAEELRAEMRVFLTGNVMCTNAVDPKSDSGITESCLSISADPLQSSRTADVKFGGCEVSMPRCGRSLLVCDDTPPWHCQLCARTYSNSSTEPPACLYCGVALGPLSPSSMLHWPGLR